MDPGLTFGFVGRMIGVLRGVGLVAPEDNQKRIDGQLPILQELAAQLEEDLADPDSLPHPGLRRAVKNYRRHIEKDRTEISIPQLHAYGLIVRNHLDAVQKQERGNMYPLDGGPLATAISLLDLNDLLIQATKEGRDLYDDADRGKFNTEEFDRFRKLELELLDKAEENGRVMAPETIELLREVVKAGGKGPKPERTGQLSAFFFRNFSMALVGAGSLAAAGSVMVQTLPAVALACCAFLIGGAFKKSKAGNAVLDVLASKIDQTFGGFVLENEDLLRKIAADRPGYQWIHSMLDWVKNTDKKDT